MQKDFQTWWNDHINFSTNLPYYKTYQALYDAGADLDYIHFLHVRLEGEDAFTRLFHERVKDANRKGRRKQKFELSPALSEKFETYARGYAEEFSKSALERAREISPDDPLLSLPLLRPLSPPLFPPLTPRAQLVAAHLRQFTEEVAERALNSAQQWLRKELEQEEKKRDEEIKSTIKKGQNMGIFREYLPDPGKYRKGGRQDRRGSFFLLAVTEHLHRKRGCYLLAARLLKAIRGQQFASAYQDRTNAKARVRNVKNSHLGWKSHLRGVRKFYLGLQASRAS